MQGLVGVYGRNVFDGAYGEEKVGNVVGDIHSDTHVCEVEAVAEPNQADGDDVMGH